MHDPDPPFVPRQPNYRKRTVGCTDKTSRTIGCKVSQPPLPESPDPSFSNPDQPKKSTTGLWILGGIFTLAVVCMVAMGVLGIAGFNALKDLSKRSAPDTQTLVTHMVALDAIGALAQAAVDKTDFEESSEFDIKKVREALSQQPWATVVQNRELEVFKPTPELKSQAMWDEYYFNEDAMVISWYLGFSNGLAPIDSDGWPNTPVITEADQNELVNYARPRSKAELLLYARQTEAWYEVFWSEDEFRQGNLTRAELKSNYRDLDEEMQSFDDPLPKKDGDYVLSDKKVKDLEKDEFDAIYWRVYRRASCFAWIRGLSRDHESASPVGYFEYSDVISTLFE